MGNTAVAGKILTEITIGNGLRTPEQFRKAFTDNRCRMGMWSNLLLDSGAFAVASRLIRLPIILVQEKDLDYPDGASPMQMLKRGQERGFYLCPFETGPQLRLQHLVQPFEQHITVATQPISIGRGHDPHLWEVDSNQHGLWLRGSFESLDTCLEPELIFWAFTTLDVSALFS